MHGPALGTQRECKQVLSGSEKHHGDKGSRGGMISIATLPYCQEALGTNRKEVQEPGMRRPGEKV